MVEQPPSIVTRGLAADARHEAMLKEAPDLLSRAIESGPHEERSDPGLLRERIRIEMQRMFRKRAGRRPLILPVVMEV
jgi:ribonuclease J